GTAVAAAVVGGAGLVLASTGYGKSTLRALELRADGPPRVRWEQPRAVALIASPVCVEGRLYQVTDKGIAACLDARTGRVLWQGRIGGTHHASPIPPPGEGYFLSQGGRGTVVAAAPEFKVLARNDLGEQCRASYVASCGQLFIRTDKHLYCIGKPKGR